MADAGENNEILGPGQPFIHSDDPATAAQATAQATQPANGVATEDQGAAAAATAATATPHRPIDGDNRPFNGFYSCRTDTSPYRPRPEERDDPLLASPFTGEPPVAKLREELRALEKPIFLGRLAVADAPYP